MITMSGPKKTEQKLPGHVGNLANRGKSKGRMLRRRDQTGVRTTTGGASKRCSVIPLGGTSDGMLHTRRQAHVRDINSQQSGLL